MTMIGRRGFLGLMGAAVALPQLVHAQGPVRRPPPSVASLITQAKLADAEVSFLAVDLASGRVIDQRDADVLLPPASTLKIVTALYALDRLGPDHRFSTRVYLDGGRLILAGGGDPVLDTDGLADLAKSTAAAVEAQGAKINAFEVWGGALPRMAELSPGQAVHLPYNPSMSGMILNFNRVHMNWRRGDAGYQLNLTARADKNAPRAFGISASVADRAAPLATYDGSGGSEVWSLAGKSMGKSGSRWLPVRRPELYAGDVFQTLCRAEGMVLPTPSVAEGAPAGAEIARKESPDLRTILRGLLAYSNNLTAEAVGIAASGAASLTQSAQDMLRWAQGHGVADGAVFADHSGLSGDSRISARMLTTLLTGTGQQFGLRDILKVDPLAQVLGKGESGQHVHAKTGTLNFVSNLSGFADAETGPVAFTIFSADNTRRTATQGHDLPPGVLAWTGRSKLMQRDLIERWVRLDGMTVAADFTNDPRG